MKTYVVQVRHNNETEPGAFVGLQRLAPDAIVELDYSDTWEIYTITTEHNIDRFLDNAPGVIEYDVHTLNTNPVLP